MVYVPWSEARKDFNSQESQFSRMLNAFAEEHGVIITAELIYELYVIKIMVKSKNDPNRVAVGELNVYDIQEPEKIRKVLNGLIQKVQKEDQNENLSVST